MAENFKDMVISCNNDDDIVDIVVSAATSQQDTKPKAKGENKDSDSKDKAAGEQGDDALPQDPDGNAVYVQSDHVLINQVGTFVMAKYNWRQISKFPFIVRHIISYIDNGGRPDVSWIVQVGNDEALELDKPVYFNIPNADFTSFAKTRRILRTQQYTLLGKEDDFFQVLEAMPKVPSSAKISTLGWSEEAKAYFFSNVAIKEGKIYSPDKFGLIEFNEKSYFMPYVESISGMENDDLANSFTYEEHKELTFNKWFAIFHRAYREHAILGACFFICSLFRDIIFHEAKFMPILFAKGAAGSGKSSFARFLTALFGQPQGEITLRGNSTKKALTRKMSQKSNAILWLDEFKNDLEEKLKDNLVSFYDGGGYERANNDGGNGTNKVDIKSALTLTSNYMPDDPVFFSRLIYVAIEKQAFTEEQSLAYDELKDMSNSINMSQIAVDILQHRELIEKEFKETYRSTKKFFKDTLPKINDRYYDNYACLITPALILLQHKKIRMVKMDFVNDLGEIARNAIRWQFNLMQENDNSVDFWNTLDVLVNTDRTVRCGVDFKFLSVEKGSEKDYCAQLAIRFDRIYVQYTQKTKHRAKSAAELRDMLINSEYFIKKQGGIRFQDDNGKPTAPTSAIVLDYRKLQNIIGVNLDQ